MNQPVAHAEVARKPADPGLMSRFVGVVVSPRETFEAVAAHPRWLGMLLLILGIVLVCIVGFLSTEVGQQAAFDQQVSRMEAFGTPMTDEQYQRMERMLPYFAYFAVANILILAPIVTLVVAGILFAVFNASLGGEATFKQVFAVVVHAGAINAVQQLFVLPLNYARESMSSPTNLAVFFPILEESSFAARLLGMIDLFIVWWALVLAIGLGVLYRRKTRPIAVSLFATYGVIAVIIATILAWRGGS